MTLYLCLPLEERLHSLFLFRLARSLILLLLLLCLLLFDPVLPVSNGLFEGDHWLTLRELYPRSKVLPQISQAFFKMHLTARGQDILSMLCRVELAGWIRANQFLQTLSECSYLGYLLRLNHHFEETH